MGKLVEGFWDCKYCQNKGIKGSIRECPSCGKPRDETTQFYLDFSQMHYVSPEKEEKIDRQPDWICSHCNTLNPNRTTHCISCGASKNDKLGSYKNFNHYSTNASSTKHSNSSTYHDSPLENKVKEEKISQKSKDSFPVNTKHSIFSKKLISFLFSKNFYIALGIVALIFSLVFLLTPRYYTVTIQDFSWERSIFIDKYQTVNESDWNLPATARLLYTRQEFSHYEQVFDHYETRTRNVSEERIIGYDEIITGYRDLGNGYFEEITSSYPIYETFYDTETYQEPIYRSEPVYRTKYYYEIDKWLYDRTVTTSAHDHSPYWGDPALASSKERISSQTETYYITFIKENEEHEETYTIPFEDWNSLELNQKIKLKFVLGTVEIPHDKKE